MPLQTCVLSIKEYRTHEPILNEDYPIHITLPLDPDSVPPHIAKPQSDSLTDSEPRLESEPRLPKGPE